MKRDDAAALPPELAQLEQLAGQADAQLAGAGDLAPGQPGQVDQAAAVDEAQEVAGMLTLIAFAAGKAMPPISEVYDAEACRSIADQYIRCADAYGWTFHKHASSPIVGLVAAAAMPALMNVDKFKAYIADRQRQAAEAREQIANASKDGRAQLAAV